jgi:hypothetical protein
MTLSRAPNMRSAAFSLPKRDRAAGLIPNGSVCTQRRVLAELLAAGRTCRWPLGGPGPSAQGALNQQHFYLGAASGAIFSCYFTAVHEIKLRNAQLSVRTRTLGLRKRFQSVNGDATSRTDK